MHKKEEQPILLMNQEQATLFLCNGCCCGHQEKGNPLVKNELFEQLLHQENLQKDVKIEKPYCLGPCSYANVVKVNKNGKNYWFRKINTEEEVHAVVEFLKNPAVLPKPLHGKQLPYG